ncbi:MAG: hypothetical protein AAFX99_08200 [Myxococcota bacterium]
MHHSDDTTATHQPLGLTLHWMRDLGLIGGATSLLATAQLHGLYGWTFPIAACLAGVVTGIALGAVIHRLFSTWMRRWPIAVLLVMGPVVGALWGGLVGLLASPTLFGFGSTDRMLIVAMVAAVAGAIQLGWFWLPYTWVRGRRKAVWPVVMLACLLGPFLGHAGLMSLSLVHPSM